MKFSLKIFLLSLSWQYLGSGAGSNLGVLLGEHFSVLNHTLDILGRESVGVVFDFDFLFVSGSLRVFI